MATFDGIDVEINGIARYTPRSVNQYASADGQQIIVTTFGESQMYQLLITAIGSNTLPSALLSTVGQHITISFDNFGSINAFVRSIDIRASQRVVSGGFFVEAVATVIPAETTS